MARHLDENDVRSLAEYARVGLADDEVLQMAAELNAIIDTLEPLGEYATAGSATDSCAVDGLACDEQAADSHSLDGRMIAEGGR